MAGVRLIIAGLGLACVAGCGGPAPPAELAGLWSTGQPSCAAGVGIRFSSDAIEAVYHDERQTLFAEPRYDVEASGEAFRVRITYALPRPRGGVAVAGAHGVLVLERHGQRLSPHAHNLIDHRTGTARLRIDDDPTAQALDLLPCGEHPWRDNLRGLSAT